MDARSLLITVALIATGASVEARGSPYQPLGTWVDPQAAAIGALAGRTPPASAATPKEGTPTRPNLEGLRARNLELLEDSLMRRHGRLLQGNRGQARQLILRRYGRAEGPLRGYMAEALFVDRNPAWHYVGKPNATQHDVYRWLDTQRTPYMGQIKYHDAGRPQLYASDMIADHRSPRFFIPDDHVAPTQQYLLSEAQRARAVGDLAKAGRLERDYARVRPIGATSAEIRNATTEAARAVARETRGGYVSMGAAAALVLAPALIDLANGKSSPEQVVRQAGRAVVVAGVGQGAELTLARVGGSVLRGSVRGNLIVAATMAVADTTWLLHQYGWRQAMYRPDFYLEAVGGVSAIALAVSGGALVTTAAAGAGPAAPLIGAGAGMVLGTIGYVGGRAAIYEILDIFAPHILHRTERERFDRALASVDTRIKSNSAWPPTPASAGPR